MKRASCTNKIVSHRCYEEKVNFLFVCTRLYLECLTSFVAGRQWFIRSTLVTHLMDEVINNTVMKFSDTPLGCSKYYYPCFSLQHWFWVTAWLFELAGGAIGDFEDTCVPKTQRETLFTVAALHQWDMGINDPRCITTAENVSVQSLRQVLNRNSHDLTSCSGFVKRWNQFKCLVLIPVSVKILSLYHSVTDNWISSLEGMSLPPALLAPTGRIGIDWRRSRSSMILPIFLGIRFGLWMLKAILSKRIRMNPRLLLMLALLSTFYPKQHMLPLWCNMFSI